MPLFSEKASTHDKITSISQVLILDKNDNVAEVLSNFFINVVPNTINIGHIEDPITRSIEQHKNHS